jgi:hypothetical protein
MAYKTLTQMTKNMLDPVRGWWDERQLSRVCPVIDADTDSVLAGMVGFLNASNQFVAGNASGASANKMPLFARGGSNDNDAVRYEGNLGSVRATATQGTPGAVGTVGKDVGISALVGTGAYELGTTAYSGSITAAGLVMADNTSSFDATNTAGTAGKGKICAFGAINASATTGTSPYLTPGTDAQTANRNQVIGIATSNAGVKNQYGVAMMYFYVNWWPAI